MEIRTRHYYKFRYQNKLLTRVEARQYGRTTLSPDGNDLHVNNGHGWHTVMYLQECVRGQKYVEDDGYLRKRDNFVKQLKLRSKLKIGLF